MAIKKSYRSDNTYMISTDTTDNPKLGAKVLSNGRESLFLDYYFGYSKVISDRTGNEVIKLDRRREYLKLYLTQSPKSPIERQQNKETLELAKKIRYEKAQEQLESTKGYRIKGKNQNSNFFNYYRNYIERYTKKDKGEIRRSLKWFMTFLRETPEYSIYSERIRPERIDKEMVKTFVDYLQSRCDGEGALTLFARFKKVVKNAVEDEVIIKNPCVGIVIRVDRTFLKKDILTMAEIQKLAATHYVAENANVRRAFLFCLYSGLRYCDVRTLTFENVDYSNKLLRFEQLKTKGHSAGSGVSIPLNEGLLSLLGKPSGDNKELIFALPSRTKCYRELFTWVTSAGIQKHITWHCARHSFAVNTLNYGANIKTVASLLGHTSLTMTERYLRAVDELKRAAIDSLPMYNS